MGVSAAACRGDARDKPDEAYKVSAAELDAMKRPGLETQFELAKDGEITFADYESAVLQMVDCAERQGVGLDEPMRLTPRKTYDLTFVATGEIALTSIGGIVAECRNEFFGVIQGMWSQHTAPTESELQYARNQIAACMRKEGKDIPSRPDREDFNPYRGVDPVYVRCQQQVSKDLGLPDFGG